MITKKTEKMKVDKELGVKQRTQLRESKMGNSGVGTGKETEMAEGKRNIFDRVYNHGRISKMKTMGGVYGSVKC